MIAVFVLIVAIMILPGAATLARTVEGRGHIPGERRSPLCSPSIRLVAGSELGIQTEGGVDGLW
jgi:hypothetical protein